MLSRDIEGRIGKYRFLVFDFIQFFPLESKVYKIQIILETY